MTDRGQAQIDYFDLTWKDINLGAAQFSLPASGRPDAVNFLDEAGADTGITTLGFAIGEKISGNFELQHDYAEGTDIYFHLHWQGITAPGGGTDNVKFQLDYTLSRNGNTLDAKTTITKEEAVTTQYAFNLLDFAAITGTNFQIGDQFLFTLTRIAASADDYAGDALVATTGIHYQTDERGSQNISSK